MKSFDTLIESTLRPITLGHPRNSFERGILESYNRCRSGALRRYLPMLGKNNINVLLKDNYLQKKEILK